jgi:predicted Rossmann fold nucleotide-binding protein DprA/Smf involved in DNA uptake
MNQRHRYVGIIGTAGRKEAASRMTAELFSAMVLRAEHTIQHVWKLPSFADVVLVSGGAAWSDHVAVALFLKHYGTPTAFAGLSLFLPCPFADNCALDSGSADWRSNPGRLMNQLHRECSRILGYDTLQQIADAHALGAELDVRGKGFHARNKLVAARADHLLAFTWAAASAVVPADGGTLHTWNLADAKQRLHISLCSL